jgi:MFS family permease
MRPMVLLFIALFNSILGLSILFPILAPLGLELGLDELHVGALSTAYAFMQFVLSPFWGKRSESRGRKPILLIGIAGFALGFFGFAIVAQLGLAGVLPASMVFGLLLLARIVGGAFSAATLPTVQAWAADLSDRENRTSAMAVIGAAFGLAVIFGPAIGAGIAWLTGDLLAPVYLSAGIAVVNAIFVAAGLREPARRGDGAPPLRLRTVARAVWPLLTVAFASTLASVAMEQTIAFYFKARLHLSNDETAVVVGLALGGYGVVAVLAQGFFVRRYALSPIALMRVGIPIALAGYVVLAFAHDRTPLICALLLQGLGQGLALPGVTAAFSLAVDESDQGSVAGLNSAAQSLGRTFGPLLGTGLYRLRPIELPYVFSAALLGLVLLAVIAWPKIAERRR